MSEELFIRGILSLVISFVMFVTIEYKYEDEIERKEIEGKRQRYQPYISCGLLMGAVIGKFVYELLNCGIGAAKHVTISICFELFFHISLYYVVLMLLLPFFRKRINARICAMMWMLPNELYLLLYGSMQLQKPIGIITVPKHIVEVVFYIWLFGFVFVLLRGLLGHLEFRAQVLKKAENVEEKEILTLWNEELKRAGMRYTKYPLMISPNVKTPLTIGLFRSTTCVLLPERRYSLEELKLVFRHEIVHIGREDAWNKFTILFWTAMCWFNPLMWAAMGKSAEDLELSCDETVLMEVDEKTRIRYANLILDTVSDERGFTTCLSASAETLKYRIKNILKPGIRKSGAFTIAVVLFVLCMSCGHIALAYGENTGEEVVYGGEDTKLYEIASMYITGTAREGTVVMECLDSKSFHKYISNLKVQNMTGNYSFGNSERKLHFAYETAKGMRYAELTDDAIRVLALDEEVEVWRSYHLTESVDWEYLNGILLLDRSSF